MEISVWGAPGLRRKLVERGIAVVDRGHPAAVLIQVFGEQDVESVRYLRERQPKLPIVIQVEHPMLALRAFELGALGVIDRDAPIATVIDALGAVIQGHTFTTRAAAELLATALERRRNPTTRM